MGNRGKFEHRSQWKYGWNGHFEECKKMYDSGMLPKDIMAHFGVALTKSSREQFRRFLNRNGLIHDNRRACGSDNPSWKGGVKLGKGGYRLIQVLDHPSVQNRKRKFRYVEEHRLVMEQHLGRYLNDSEVVHHINKNVLDNRIENLQLFDSNGSHLSHELDGQCPNWSPEGKARILKAVRQSRKKKPFSSQNELGTNDYMPLL